VPVSEQTGEATTRLDELAQGLAGQELAVLLEALIAANRAMGDVVDQTAIGAIALKYAAKPEANGDGHAEEDPLAELTALLALHTVGLRVKGAIVYGRGSKASASVFLSDDGTLLLEPLGSYSAPARLAAEVVSTTGAVPKLKGPDAMRVVALIHKIAKHFEGADRDAAAIDWGSDFLQTAETLSVDIDNQVERWSAFVRLRDTDPVGSARTDNATIASRCIVLVDPNGTRYVRCGWFLGYVRSLVGTRSPQELNVDMERVGWRRPSKSGRIKATSPRTGDTLNWSFYVVPMGWESRR
jgi:hypothetical protein